MSRFVRYLSFYNNGPRKFVKIELTSVKFKLPYDLVSSDPPTELIDLPRKVDTALLKIRGYGGGDFDIGIKDKIWWYRYFSTNRTNVFYITQEQSNYYISFPIGKSDNFKSTHLEIKEIKDYDSMIKFINEYNRN